MKVKELKDKNLKEIDFRETAKNYWAGLTLIPIFLLSIFLRYLPAQDMEYLQALDSYLIYKQSQFFAYTGSLPILDFSRYFPYPTPQYIEDLGGAIIPAVIYYMGPFLVFDSFLEYAQFYTPLIGGLSVVAMYFIGKEIFGKVTGLTSAFFLAVISGVMHRSSAGFFQKDPLGAFLGLVSIYFFVRGWKESSWISGIISGIFLGLFTWSWGGSSFLWLLYALTVAAVLFINVDTRNLVAVFTPTVIIGAIIGFTGNPSSWWFFDTDFLPSVGVLAVLWLRYLVEELKLVEGKNLDYFIPSVYGTGLLALILSPLYSNWVASQFVSLIGMISRGGSSSAIGGTVAESTPMSVTELSSQLGSNLAGIVNPVLGYLANIIGTWPLAFIGTAGIASTLIAMIGVKYNLLDNEITKLEFYELFSIVFLAWLIVFSIAFQSPGLVVLPALVMVIGGGVLVYMFESDEEEPEKLRINIDWRYSLVLFWILSTVIAATSESRIVFLAAFPTSLAAGYTSSIIIKEIYSIDYSEVFDNISSKITRNFVLGAFITLLVVVNAAAGYASVQNISESPNELWQENLDYISEETDSGSVIMSWWDYGYHFQSLGERTTVADGGNLRYFTSESEGRMPYHLADFFTSTQPENHSDLLEKHSTDYLVLDETMIGKYSAVSQIANRDNEEFESMQQVETSRDIERSISRGENGSASIEFQGRQFSVFAPVEIEETDLFTTVEFSGPPTMQTSQGRLQIDCVLTDDGRVDFDIEGESADFCLAENPYYNFDRAFLSEGLPARGVLVPKEITDHVLVQLYLMDGTNYDFVEKVDEGSNDFIKMWEVDQDELE